jgi:hypothetical protein
VRNSVKKWCGFGVVLMKSGEKKWKSEKKLQKVNENIWQAQRRKGGSFSGMEIAGH